MTERERKMLQTQRGEKPGTRWALNVEGVLLSGIPLHVGWLAGRSGAVLAGICGDVVNRVGLLYRG